MNKEAGRIGFLIQSNNRRSCKKFVKMAFDSVSLGLGSIGFGKNIFDVQFSLSALRGGR